MRIILIFVIVFSVRVCVSVWCFFIREHGNRHEKDFKVKSDSSIVHCTEVSSIQFMIRCMLGKNCENKMQIGKIEIRSSSEIMSSEINKSVKKYDFG